MRTPFLLVAHPLHGLDVGAAVSLDEDQVHHLRTVLRRGDGDPVEVTDGAGGVAEGQLVGERVRLTGAVLQVPAPRPSVTVVHAVPKGRALDEIVRTLAELGVASVHPVLTHHTESRPTGQKARSVGDRLRAVAKSALEQAHSAHLMEVTDPADLAVTLRSLPTDATRLAAHPAADTTLGARMATAGPDLPLQLLIGPEGGIAPTELDELRQQGWQPVRAGHTVLRTVHAATVLTAAVLALVGRFGDDPVEPALKPS